MRNSAFTGLLRIGALLLPLLVFTNCGALGGRSSAAGASAAVSPVGLAMYLTYESVPLDESGPPEFTCYTSTSAAVGTVKTCDWVIPEARLFFSKAKFIPVGPQSHCALTMFHPYYYQASTAAAFAANWLAGSTAVCDGSTTPLPADCFGGPAKTITSFPIFTGIYIPGGTDNPTSTATLDFEVDSSNEATVGSNRQLANNLSTASRATTFAIGAGDGYIMNTMQDYTVTCRDEYYKILYQVVVTISDADDSTSADSITADEAEDWKPY